MSHYGFIRVHRDVKKAIASPQSPTPQQVQPLPTTDVAQAVLQYAEKELPQKVLLHSLRVYQYSLALIKDHFPAWDLDASVLLATCLLHDIGTTEKNMAATKMSFEFYGGILSSELIMALTADQDFAEAVAEAIIRHQDLGDSGYITSLGLVLQLATLIDNVGLNLEYIHKDTLDNVNQKYPRDGWLGCFAHAIDAENNTKPWGHTSSIEGFRDKVLGNRTQYQKL